MVKTMLPKTNNYLNLLSDGRKYHVFMPVSKETDHECYRCICICPPFLVSMLYLIFTMIWIINDTQFESDKTRQI